MPTQLQTNISLIEDEIQELIDTTTAIINHTPLVNTEE